MGSVQLSAMVVSSTDSTVRFSGGIAAIRGLVIHRSEHRVVTPNYK